MVYTHTSGQGTALTDSGIGERNGITSLGGLMARMIVADRDYVKSKVSFHEFTLVPTFACYYLLKKRCLTLR